MANKPTILVMSDHSALHTGFATVSRHILRHLHATGKYNLYELGWFSPNPANVLKENEPQWECYCTDKRNEQDVYGRISLPRVISKVQPQILLTIGDQWMIDHGGDHRDKFPYIWINYSPIDGMPHPPEWTKTFASPEIMVAYGQWGLRVMKQRNPKINAEVIWHGVDTENFRPLPFEEKEEQKNLMSASGCFLLGCVARNQPRKQIPIIMKACAAWVHEHYVDPLHGKSWICEPDKLYMNELIYAPSEIPFMSETRKNPKASPFSGHTQTGKHVPSRMGKVKLCLHMAFDDVGWDINEQIGRYKLQGFVVHNPNLLVGHGIDDAGMNRVYNAFDLFVLPTIGEGWGLPISEAMACGIPILVTNYSAHTEWCFAGGLPLDVRMMITEPKTNIERAYVDIPDFVMKLDRFYLESDEFNRIYKRRLKPDECGKALRDKFSAMGHELANSSMDWEKHITPQWEKLVDKALTMEPKFAGKKTVSSTISDVKLETV